MGTAGMGVQGAVLVGKVAMGGWEEGLVAMVVMVDEEAA